MLVSGIKTFESLVLRSIFFTLFFLPHMPLTLNQTYHKLHTCFTFSFVTYFNQHQKRRKKKNFFFQVTLTVSRHTKCATLNMQHYIYITYLYLFYQSEKSVIMAIHILHTLTSCPLWWQVGQILNHYDLFLYSTML